MNMEKLEDVKDTALKLGVIHSQCPADYSYLKGWIHCLLHREKHTQDHSSSSTTKIEESLSGAKNKSQKWGGKQ